MDSVKALPFASPYCMAQQENNEPDISEFVKKHLPDAPLAEQLEAQAAVDNYLRAVLRIYERLKREGKWPEAKQDETEREAS